MILGHSISNAKGVIQAIDEPVAAMLQRTQKQLVGLSYTSITHPDDLPRNLTQVAALQPNGPSVRILKRYIGGEGAIVTLEVQVSRLTCCQSEFLVGTLSTVSDPGAKIPRIIRYNDTPHTLWRRARDLLEVMRARDELLGSELFADHAWSILLLVYVAEAECRITTISSIVGDYGLPQTMLVRWARVLQAKSLIEETAGARDALQLTQKGIDCIEHLLALQSPVSVN